MGIYKDKFLYRIKMAEVKDREVERWESWASEKSRSGNEELRLLQIKQALEKKMAYQTAINIRNIHLRWAEVYGLAALLEEVDNPNDETPGS